LFSAHKILRDYQIDADDIDSGLVGTNKENRSGSDGGLDGFYIFVNGKIIRTTDDAENAKHNIRRNVSVDIVLLQATREDKFSLARVLRISDTCTNIFSIADEPKHFTEKYNSFLLDGIERFRTLHRLLGTSYPVYKVSIYYASKGEVSDLGSAVSGKASELCEKIKNNLPTVKEANFTFLGARQLIELSQKPPKLTFTLECSGLITAMKSGGHVALLPLTEFFKFIRADDGTLRTSLFESNVRDYQGAVSVNEGIETSLKNPGAEDFWWLNNGITVVADNVGGDSRQLVLTEPQIVNGLQTAQKIFDYFTNDKTADPNDTRQLLVRVIKAPNIQSHDQIILATNSQTVIPKASLWATNQIHRNIEAHFRSFDLYYDRRKNSWRREGKEFSKVVGITELAQAVASILRREPNEARGSPGRYFSKQRHNTIFSENFSPRMYVVCAIVKKRAVTFLRTAEPDKIHINNLLFYLLTATVCLVLKNAHPGHAKIAEMNLDKLTDVIFQEALEIVRPIYYECGGTDQAAKGADMMTKLRSVLAERLQRRSRERRKGKNKST